MPRKFRNIRGEWGRKQHHKCNMGMAKLGLGLGQGLGSGSELGLGLGHSGKKIG